MSGLKVLSIGHKLTNLAILIFAALLISIPSVFASKDVNNYDSVCFPETIYEMSELVYGDWVFSHTGWKCIDITCEPGKIARCYYPDDEIPNVDAYCECLSFSWLEDSRFPFRPRKNIRGR